MKRAVIVFLSYCLVCCGSAFSGQETTQGSGSTGSNAATYTRGEWTKGELIRGIFGLQQAGASSTQSKQGYFADIYLSTPFPYKTFGHNDVIGARVRVWGYFRMSSIPQQVNSSLSQFVSEFGQNASQIKINELARSAEFRAGFEVILATLGMNRRVRRNEQTVQNENDHIYTLSFIAATGASTPLYPKEVAQIFKVTDSLKNYYPDINFGDNQYAAFIIPERDRFYRQYDFGIRLKSYAKPNVETKGNTTKNVAQFPGQFDITWGLDDSATGGKFGKKNTVFRLDGFLPLEQVIGDTGDLRIYVFASAIMKTSKTKINYPPILEEAPSGTTLFSQGVIQIPEPEMSRDYYRIGIGVDLAGLVKKIFAKTTEARPEAKAPAKPEASVVKNARS